MSVVFWVSRFFFFCLNKSNKGGALKYAAQLKVFESFVCVNVLKQWNWTIMLQERIHVLYILVSNDREQVSNFCMTEGVLHLLYNHL